MIMMMMMMIIIIIIIISSSSSSSCCCFSCGNIMSEIFPNPKHRKLTPLACGHTLRGAWFTN